MSHPYSWLRLIGTGLVCGGLLIYQILSARIMSVVVEEQIIIFAVSIAMLGMGVATSLMSLASPPHNLAFNETSKLGWIAAGLGFSYVLILYLATRTNDAFNIGLENAIDHGGRTLLFATIRSTLFIKMGIFGALLSFPYFIFGIFIGVLFLWTPSEDYHKVYAADLIGASTGCVVAVIALDYFGFAGAIAAILLATFAGGAAFSLHRSQYALSLQFLCVLLTIILVTSSDLIRRVEPSPSIGLLSRNFDREYTATAGWHTWNAHSRIANVTLSKNDGTSSAVYAHESGEGWAIVPTLESAATTSLSRLTTMFKPQKVLVLFAGVGADLVAIDSDCNGECELSGVEINKHMVDHALSNGSPELKAFLSRPNIKLHVAEAREFLERDKSKYDAILLSWWGAGASHYVGTSGKLAQYMYTKEAFEVLLDHLTPRGTVILYNGSKAQTLAVFAEIFRERNLGKLSDHTIVARESSVDEVGSDRLSFYDVAERMRMVVKPSGFSAQEMSIVRATVSSTGSDLILYPGGVEPRYAIYLEIAEGDKLASINTKLAQDQGLELSIVTDDRPFINELISRSTYFNLGALLGAKSKKGAQGLTRGYVLFTLAISVAALVLIFAPLLFKSGPKLSASNFVRIAYFFSLGAGFMMIEIGLIRKFGLLLGHPSYSISVILASLILSTGIGALASQKLFSLRILTEKRTVLLIICYVVAFSAGYPWFAAIAISFPIALKAALSIFILFPLGFLMGQLFPQGLVQASKENAGIVPWAWAINGTSSTIASSLAFLLSYPLGFDMIIYIGTGIYSLILILPLMGTSRSDANVKMHPAVTTPWTAPLGVDRSD